MSASQSVGAFPRMIATATRPGLLESDGPAHMEDTGGVRNPAAPSSTWRPKTSLDTIPPLRRSTKPLSSLVAVGIGERCAAYGRRQTLSTTDLSLRWLPTLRCILAMPRLNPTMRRALGCALRCLDPTYPDSPLGPNQDASLASQCGNRGSNSKLRSLLPPWECIAADVERQDSHCLAKAQIAIACFLAALRRRRTNNFERDVVSARGPAEERTGVPSLRPRWNTAGGNTNVRTNVWIGVCVRACTSVCLCLCMCLCARVCVLLIIIITIKHYY